MARTTPDTETDLARAVVAWLTEFGWEVYQEVQPQRNGAVADLVAVRRQVVWVIECKRSLSLALLEQAHGWLGRAHCVSIATPRARRQPRGHQFAAEALRLTGMGWLEVDPSGRGEPVAQRVKPAIGRTAAVAPLRAALDERHKTYAPAGNAQSRRWTPFQRTSEAIRATVAAQPGILLSDLVVALAHHYRTDTAARGTLAKRLRQGVVVGAHLRKVDGRLRVYPDVGWESPESDEAGNQSSSTV